jgi:hypothetical protein
MRRLLLAVLLACASACSGATSNPSPPAPAPAISGEPAGDDDAGANFASPPVAEEAPPESPAAQVPPEMADKIRSAFGDGCRFERACGGLVGVDCNSAADGPYYYVREGSLEVVSTCGGACRAGCTECPPKAWDCPTY